MRNFTKKSNFIRKLQTDVTIKDYNGLLLIPTILLKFDEVMKTGSDTKS